MQEETTVRIRWNGQIRPVYVNTPPARFSAAAEISKNPCADLPPARRPPSSTSSQSKRFVVTSKWRARFRSANFRPNSSRRRSHQGPQRKDIHTGAGRHVFSPARLATFSLSRPGTLAWSPLEVVIQTTRSLRETSDCG
jgi:hypothetical protein